MKQLTQKLGSGHMEIQELPLPKLGKGMVLVKNYYSIISAGTEGSTVKAARKNLIGKAKDRPKQVIQVIDTLRREGPLKTYRAVMKKLDSYSPLGYSCSGEVIDVGEGVVDFTVGDLVACAGANYANHAEVITVPVNLCVKLDDNVNMMYAAYNTLGAISMQGVRQADMRIGESCAIIGMGLLGQLAALILKASGVKVIGIDLNKEVVDFCNKHSICFNTFLTTQTSLENKIYEITNGIGVDAVIIAAATKSNDPINLAGAISRKKGKVVVMGDVPTGFDRNPHWYIKELELKMACSYGPGRYDLNYEQKGIDYPVSYVRWTEKRNMEAFQELLFSEKIDISFLSTHKYKFEDAAKAYDLVLSKSDFFIGIVLTYNKSKKHKKNKIKISKNKEKVNDISISFIGAGSYAQGNLLPNIPDSKKITKQGILTQSGTTSKRVAEKFNFAFCTNNEDDIFDDRTNLIFVATRHDSHATYVKKALTKNKHVFVEKPLCIFPEDLDEITELESSSNSTLMLGYNRRFSPFAEKILKVLDSSPISFIYRINAGSIPKENWIQDSEIGGGRIIGEVCHFIDFLHFLTRSFPKSVSAQVVSDTSNLNDTINILLKFKDGSSGVICYLSNGSKSIEKEYLEINSCGTSIIMRDFKELTVYSNGKSKRTKLFNQNKGQKEMIETYMSSLSNKGISPISINEIISVSKTCFTIIESIKNGGKNINL